jgi:hypothetical protein
LQPVARKTVTNNNEKINLDDVINSQTVWVVRTPFAVHRAS